jgi:thiamine biosynthesis protein ThiS
MNQSTQEAPLPIILNEQPCVVPTGSSLTHLIRRKVTGDERAVTVALNGVFIRHADWDAMTLTANDQVVLIASL